MLLFFPVSLLSISCAANWINRKYSMLCVRVLSRCCAKWIRLSWCIVEVANGQKLLSIRPTVRPLAGGVYNRPIKFCWFFFSCNSKIRNWKINTIKTFNERKFRIGCPKIHILITKVLGIRFAKGCGTENVSLESCLANISLSDLY